MPLPKSKQTVNFQYQYDLIDAPDDVAFTPKPRKYNILLFFLRLYNKLAELINKEQALGSFFLFLPIFTGSGAIYYFNLSYEPLLTTLTLIFCISILLMILFKNKPRIFIITTIFTVFLTGMLLAKLETIRFDTRFIQNSITTTITGRILSIENGLNGNYRLNVEVLQSQQPPLDFAPKKIRLTARSLPKNVNIGDGLQGLVRLRPPAGPARLGGYNFSFHNFYSGISAQGFFMGRPQLVTIAPSSSRIQKVLMTVAQLRLTMTNRITSAIDGEAGAIAAALITGQRGGITDETNSALRVAGLSHILSISGLHMAMVTGMILLSMRLVLACFPIIVMHYPAKKIAAVIALCFASFYLILSGSDIAAQRSYIMVAVMMVAIFFDRSALTMRNLAIAALITIAIFPHAILGPSFQMSFSATASLIAIFGWWSNRKKNDTPYIVKKNAIRKYLIIPIISTIVTSLVAGFASGIFAAYHFNNTAPLGILGNALAFPIMSIFVMPFALLATILMLLHLEWLALQIMGFGVELVKSVAVWVTSISPNFQVNSIDQYDLAVLTFGLVILFFCQTKLRLLGFVPLCLGMIMTFFTNQPIALIAEDGRLVAASVGDHKFAINQQRPPAYILNNWLASLRLTNNDIITLNNKQNDGFICSDFICNIKIANDKLFTIIESPNFVKGNCSNADIIFLNYISIDYRELTVSDCSQKALIITRTDLLLFGTAELYQNHNQIDIKWASNTPQRRWNSYRRLTKNALGIND